MKTGSKMGYENHEEYGSGNMIDDLIRFSVQIGMVNASSNYIWCIGKRVCLEVGNLTINKHFGLDFSEK